MRLLLFALAERIGTWDVDALAEAMPASAVIEWGTFREVRAEMEKDEIRKQRREG